MEVMNIRVQRGANSDSDHYMTRIQVKPIPDNNKKTTAVQKYTIEKMKINQELTENYPKELDTLISYEWDKIIQKIYETAKNMNFLAKKEENPWQNE